MSFIFQNGTATGTVNTTMLTVTAGKKGIFDMTFCKTTTGVATVNVSVTNGATTTYLEHGVQISYGSPLIRTREMLTAGCVLKVLSDVALDYTLAGIEEAL